MQEFDQTLAQATRTINQDYFQLSVGEEGTILFREQVYCYELYHQMRMIWPNTNWKICGEVDKSGHPILRDSNESPDFLVHVPGEPANFAIIEVKPANFRKKNSLKISILFPNLCKKITLDMNEKFA